LVLGAEPVVPILSISGLLINASRVIAFLRYAGWKIALIIVPAALPACVLGAYGYTMLTSAGVMMVIGAMLCLSVPFRRMLLHFDIRIGKGGLAVGSAGFGFLAGGTAGSGVILLSLLMAAGLGGAAVVATDAVVSVAIGLTKIFVFGFSGVMTVQVVAFGLLIGLVALPGAFLARAFVAALPLHVHTGILDAVVMLGGAAMIVGAFR
ncbi:MAG: sulfite exporter TauE/SafE family protein, partial [Xanthobacteraceae bacterium]